jgi:acyl carrier protein
MSTSMTRDHARQTMIDAIVEMGPEPESVTPDSTWEELDLDSLDLVEIAQIIEEELGVRIAAEDAKDWERTQDVFDFVYGKLGL